MPTLVHPHLFALLGVSILLGSVSARAASISYSVSLNTTDPGYANSFSLNATKLDTSTTGPVTISGITAFDLGYFTAAGSNTNVVSNFTLTVDASVTQGATSVSEPLTFTGSITNPSAGVYDLNFSSPGNTTYTDSNYPGGGLTFATESTTFGSLGTYTLGVATDYQITTSSGKATTIFAMITPGAITPEPLSAGLTGIAMLGLLGFAARRKFRAAQS